MRVLSGIQPSGKLHLGNYLGAIKQHLELQHEHECLYFIANLHSLTTVQDPAALRQLTLDVALDYLALGLDPAKATLFRQSDVPEVTELTWVLATVTGKGLLDRAHSFKDKTAQGIVPSMGLYCYPLLMASDILIYDSNLVPVGKDQVQHIEMTQDMAGYFNNTFGETLIRPEPKLNEAMVVPGIDGRKMSKSYGNAIDLFDAPKPTRKRIMSIVTDSTPVEDPKNPETCNVFNIYRLMATPDEVADLEAAYRKGGTGYGEAKKRLADVFERTFGEARDRRAQLAADPDTVEDVLAEGGRKARAIAQRVMARVRDACGIARAHVVDVPDRPSLEHVLMREGERQMADRPTERLMKDEQFRYFEAMNLLRGHWFDSFNKRRAYEYKICLSLWTALLAFCGLVISGRVSSLTTDWRYSVIVTLVSVTVFLLHWSWLTGVKRANYVDKMQGAFLADEMLSQLNLTLPDDLGKMIVKMKPFRGPRRWWNEIFQLGTTLVLCVLSALICWVR